MSDSDEKRWFWAAAAIAVLLFGLASCEVSSAVSKRLAADTREAE